MNSLNFFYIVLFLLGIYLILSKDEGDDDDRDGGIFQPVYNGGKA